MSEFWSKVIGKFEERSESGSGEGDLALFSELLIEGGLYLRQDVLSYARKVKQIKEPNEAEADWLADYELHTLYTLIF